MKILSSYVQHCEIRHRRFRCDFLRAERLSALNFVSDWFQLKVEYDSSDIRSPGTPIRGHTPVRQTD